MNGAADLLATLILIALGVVVLLPLAAGAIGPQRRTGRQGQLTVRDLLDPR
jgi:hypothetical protein